MIVVYDIETFLHCFTYSAICKESKKEFQYVLHKDLFQFDELLEHLNGLQGMIGFNNLEFDYPVIHYILTNQKLLRNSSKEEVIRLIYTKANEIIHSEGFKRIKNKDILIPQLDLYLIWHFDNQNKRTSLKHLEVSMNFPNVMEIPLDIDSPVSLEDINTILEYNMNDVLATYEFYERSRDKIEFRKDLTNKYKIDFINYNNGKIGETLLLELFSKKTKQDKWELKEKRTHRSIINLGECIPEVNFETKTFNKLVDFYKNKSILSTKDEGVSTSLIFNDVLIVYGIGGIHGCIHPGVYESDDDILIKTFDVTSLYPNLGINLNLYANHLGPVFVDVYKDDIVDVRMNEKNKPAEEQNKTIINGYKEAANVPYGKSNSPHSFLYDPLT